MVDIVALCQCLHPHVTATTLRQFGSVSKVEMVTAIALIYKELFLSISTSLNLSGFVAA